MLDAFIQSITFTSQGPWEVVFFLKRRKEILGEFLVALQYDCTQITALMLPVINRKLKKNIIESSSCDTDNLPIKALLGATSLK